MSETTIAGGCHCGDVRYQAPAGLGFQFLCTCDNCRALSGGLRLAGASIAADTLQVEGTTRQYEYAGGNGKIELHFCPSCATHLFAYPRAHPGAVVLRAGTLDDQGEYAPVKSIFEGQACQWDLVVDAPKG